MPVLFQPTAPLIVCATGFREEQELQLRLFLSDVIPAWHFAFGTIANLMRLQFDGDADATRRYVIEHRTERDGLTLSQLLFERKQRAVDLHVGLLDALRSGAT